MITTYVVLQAVMFLISIGGFVQVKQFLSRCGSIRSEDDLTAFKKLARVNMYVALGYMAIGGPTILLSIYIGYMYSFYGIGIVLLVSVPQFLFGKYLKGLEDKTRSMTCSDAYLLEHRRVTESWLKKALPDF